jgi:hypothetical protein
MIAAVLAERLKHSVGEGARLATPAPSTITLLDLDARYRMAVEADTLVKIKPLRNNPQNSYWLPVMHETHDGWHFTVMFSNTTRAHELGKTRDWVVIYYQKEGFPEGRCTVVTEYQGQRKGQRVVRGGVVAATAAQ